MKRNVMILIALALILTACGNPEVGDIMIVTSDFVALDEQVLGVHSTDNQNCLLDKDQTVKVISVFDPHLEVVDLDDPDCHGFAGQGNFKKVEKK